MQAQSPLSVHLHLWFHSNWVKMYVWNGLICCLTITNPGPRKICEGFILYFWRKFWPWDFYCYWYIKMYWFTNDSTITGWRNRGFFCATYCKDGRKATLSSNTVTDYFNFVWCVFWRYTDIYMVYMEESTLESCYHVTYLKNMDPSLAVDLVIVLLWVRKTAETCISEYL